MASEFPKEVSELIARVKTEGDSVDACRDRFRKVVRHLIVFLKDVNVFMKGADGTPPISPLLLDISGGAVASMTNGMADEIIDTFVSRAVPEAHNIKSRDVKAFAKSAEKLFEGIPKDVISTIVKLVESDSVPPETINDTFNFVDSLMRISLKRECILLSDGVSTIDINDVNAAIQIFFAK
jgi:hypothetical protein